MLALINNSPQEYRALIELFYIQNDNENKYFLALVLLRKKNKIPLYFIHQLFQSPLYKDRYKALLARVYNETDNSFWPYNRFLHEVQNIPLHVIFKDLRSDLKKIPTAAAQELLQEVEKLALKLALKNAND